MAQQGTNQHRRAKGSGTLTERKPGVWTIRAFAGVGPDGKRQYVARTVHGGKRVAQTELSQLVAERTAPITADVTMMMSQLLDRWMEEMITPSRHNYPSSVTPSFARRCTRP